jgi:hypothetical protein
MKEETTMRENAIAISLGFVLILFFMGKARGQETWGAITGYVTDQSGAAVPSAAVAVTNEETGVQNRAVTDSAGLYDITHLNPGVYAVAVEAAGFKRFIQRHIVLAVDSTVRVDPKLELGAVTQEITVTASAAELKAEKTDVAAVVSEHEIDSLPMPNHNITKLYLTAPGVVNNVWQVPNTEQPSEGLQTSVNGQLWGANDFMVDGVSNQDYGWSGFQVIVPPQDSVQELKVTTGDYDPEYGSAGGMIAQYVTKYGTNDLHGSVYWFNENKFSFAANPFTEKIPGTGPEGKGTGPSPFNENVGGFSLGGPIKRNSMFLFGDYRLDRRLTGGELLTTVPNNAFRNGDFSAFASTNPIFDPLTGNPDGTGRQQFSCNGVLNIICPDRIDQVSKNLINLLPPPNLNQNTDLNFLGSGSALFSTDEIDERYDWNISQKDKLFVRDSFMWSYLYGPGVFGSVAGGPAIGLNSSTVRTHNNLFSLNFTHTFSPSLLTEVRAGLTRFVLNGYQNDANLRTDDQVGIPNINTGSLITGGLSPISVAGPLGSFSMGIGGSIPRLERSTMIQLVNNWTKMSAGHQFTWGADIRRNRNDLFTLAASSRGDYDFYQGVTGSAAIPNSGLGMASFLLGEMGYWDRGVFVIFPGERVTRLAFYGGDTWRVTRKLTFNYGLRWDYFEPVTPRKPGGDVNYDMNTGMLLLSGLGSVSKYGDVQPRHDNFAPRLGLAYKLTDKTVIRAGFGRSYFLGPYDSVFNHMTTSYPIAQLDEETQAGIYEPISFKPENTPPVIPVPPLPSSGIMANPPTQGVKPFPFVRQISNINTWNFTVERVLTKDLKLSVAYVGNSGEHLDYDWYNYNAAPPGPGDLLSRRPYYQKFGLEGTMFYVCPCDNSNYNSLQVVVTKHFSKGYSISSSYTWSKALDNEIGDRSWGDQATNPYDMHGSYGTSDFNRASVWTLTHTWQLPYGKGLRFGSDATGVKKALLAGWQFNGITQLESGFPVSATLNDNSTLNADFGQRPNRVSGVPLYPAQKSATLWFNPAAFAPPPACCVWGNAARSDMRGPGFGSADWSFSKDWSFKTPLSREETVLQFRWENFNFFNQTNLGQPVEAVDSPLVGQITDLAGPGGGWRTAFMRRMQFGFHLQW